MDFPERRTLCAHFRNWQENESDNVCIQYTYIVCMSQLYQKLSLLASMFTVIVIIRNTSISIDHNDSFWMKIITDFANFPLGI